MGFIEGLTDILGGWNAARRIDKEGFDWREKAQADQFGREQERQDWATKAAAEAGLGAEDEDAAMSAMESTIPADVNRAAVLHRARGLGRQSRSALKWQEGQQRLDEIAARGDEQEALARVRASLVAGQEPSPKDVYVAEQAAKRQGISVQAMLQATGARIAQGDRFEAGRNRRWGSMPVQVPTGEYDVYGNPVVEFQPRADVLGTTTIKPNPTEFRARIEGELGRESMATNLDTIQRQLDEVKRFSGVTALTSPVDAFNARETYKATIKNLAIAANRVLGDTSGRYSDVDREVAAAMLGVANDPLLIANPEMAQTRLDEARKTISAMGAVQRRVRPAPPRGGGGVPTGGQKTIVQRSRATGQWRHSLDGGRTWQLGRP